MTWVNIANLMRRAAPRGFWRAQRGATAVEFAMVGGVFFLMLFSIFEIGFILVVSIMLENALNAASRKIRVGDSATISSNLEQFRLKVCDSMAFLQPDCVKHLYVDVDTVITFSAANLADPGTNNGELDTSGFGFNPGQGAPNPSIVVVRAYYKWPMIAPLMNQSLVRSDGATLIKTSAVFKNEPYGSGAASPN